MYRNRLHRFCRWPWRFIAAQLLAWSGLRFVFRPRIAIATRSTRTCRTSPASTPSSGALSGSSNKYNINTLSSGPAVTYAFTPGTCEFARRLRQRRHSLTATNGDSNVTNGSRITNNWLVCTVRATAINCPSAAGVLRAQAIPAATLAALGLTVNPAATAITTAEAFGNPFLVRNTTRVRDFELGRQDLHECGSVLHSGRLQVCHATGSSASALAGIISRPTTTMARAYIKFNNFWDNLAPRLGLTWDFTGKGKGKLFANYATFIETPIPLDVNVRAARWRRSDRQELQRQHAQWRRRAP